MAKSDVLIKMKADVSNYDANIAKARKQLEGFKKDNLSVGGVMKQVSGSMVSMAAQYASVAAAIGGIGMAFRDNIETARNFEKSMSQLSSLTGKTGEELNRLKEYAIELGGSTTLTASQVANAFRLIGSQQPQLLESSEALKEVTKQAITLAEAAGIELETAAQTLSTSINQMGGDSDNAARYVNVLAAAAQKGAGDIAWLGEAITKSATAAKAVGTDYEELVANLEQLAKAGFDASTAGTALRSIIMNLEKQANNEFKPSVVGLTQAFENLGKANLSIVEYQQLTGKMFASQAMALANAAGEAKKMAIAITDTNIAEEQAKTNTDNLDGSIKALSSAWEAFNLHLNSSNGYLKTVVDGLKDIVTWADKAIAGLGEVKGNRDKLNGEGTGGSTKVDRQIAFLGKVSAANRNATYNNYVKEYERYIEGQKRKLKEAEGRNDVFVWQTLKKNSDIATARDNIAGAESMLRELKNRAKSLITTPKGKTDKGDGGKADIDLTVDVDGDGSGMKSIKDLQTEIKKLKSLRDEAASAGDTKLRDQYNSQIKSLENQIKIMRGNTTTTTTKIKTETTELQENQKKINQLTQEYVKLSDSASGADMIRLNTIREEIAELEKRNNLLKLYGEQSQGKLRGGDIQTTDLAPHGVTAVDPYIYRSIGKGLDPKNLPSNQLAKDGKTIADSWKDAASAVGSVGDALSQIKDPTAQAAGIVAKAIATIALGFAQATETASATGIFGWIASLTAGAASMMTAIGAIHSATGYASGGKIKGTSFSGDNLLAQGPDGNMIGLNAEEIVLNKAQSNILASQLQNSGGGSMGNMQPYVTGDYIYLGLSNWLQANGYGKLVTTNMR